MNGEGREHTALGVRHALLVYTSPQALFGRVEDTGAYGWALVTLLGLVTLAGYVQIKTGLIDQLVDAGTDKKLEQIESRRADLVERGQLREAIEKTRQEGEFFKTITRLQVIALEPMLMLAKFLLIAAVLYAAVALTGRKPEYHTLMSICVYSGFIGLAGHVLRVAMMMYYRRIDMDTSLSMLAEPGKPTVLAAFDPFVIWFWVVVALGLIITRQLSRRIAIVSCVLLCTATMAMRVAVSYGSA